MAEVGTVTRMRAAAAALGLEVAAEDWSKICKTLILLDKYRASLNLTGRGGLERVEDHAIEALVAVRAALGAVDQHRRWLDVGSGGGFPGLIAAAVWEGGVTLVEPRAKRAAFLELAVASAGLRASVRRARLEAGESVVMDGRGPLSAEFGVASARAVFSPAAWLCECRHWIAGDGVCLVHLRAGEGGSTEDAHVRAHATYGRWEVLAVVPRETPPQP